jgi:hypothetical protein
MKDLNVSFHMVMEIVWYLEQFNVKDETPYKITREQFKYLYDFEKPESEHTTTSGSYFSVRLIEDTVHVNSFTHDGLHRSRKFKYI